jgi:hypothetical protein
VGCHFHVPPFSFVNSHNNLVGYDIAFAEELARDLQVSLELVPLHFNAIAEELEQGSYDIVMSALTVTEERIKNMGFTSSYAQGRIVFIVPEKWQKKVSKPFFIQKNPSIPIAVLEGSSFEARARYFFPDHPLIPLKHYESFQEQEGILLCQEQEAIFWILHHPNYQIVYPNPSLGMDTLAYAIQPGADRFLNYLEHWLELKKSEGFTEQQYCFWILGKTEAEPLKPRWSVVRDLLHWKE